MEKYRKKQSVDDLLKLSGEMFTKQHPMIGLYQTLADHFYPERADFTTTRNTGQELADSVVDSYPLLVRRDLGNAFSAMLRDGEWFHIGINGEPSHVGKMWLQFASSKLLRLFNHQSSNFTRATKEGDHDFATFGQCVISGELNRKANGLLFRCWHLRDVAWMDGINGQVECVARKWTPTYKDLVEYFGDNVHKYISSNVQKTPFNTADVRHMVLPSHMYGDDAITDRFPFVSCYIDVKHQHLMEVTGIKQPYYVVPRFQTIAGSPYAYSPATVVGLPDARTLQAMTFTLLEAGERYARPPIIATQKVIRGDVNLNPDGITWVDRDYDEKKGAALSTLPQDRGGFPMGMAMRDNIISVLNSAFYANKLSMPDTGHEMTAYEVQERMKQYRRENLPLFGPIESEYSAKICELGFQLAMDAGMLGSPYDIPEELHDKDAVFEFVSPLSSSQEEKKATQFSQTARLLSEVAAFDPNVAHNVNFDVALRDAILGTGSPASWLKSMEEVLNSRQLADTEAAMQQQVEQAAAMQGVA